MKKKCPYCSELNNQQGCGYFECGKCKKWYLPIRENEPESKGDLKEFLDSEERQ